MKSPCPAGDSRIGTFGTVRSISLLLIIIRHIQPSDSLLAAFGAQTRTFRGDLVAAYHHPPIPTYKFSINKVRAVRSIHGPRFICGLFCDNAYHSPSLALSILSILSRPSYAQCLSSLPPWPGAPMLIIPPPDGADLSLHPSPATTFLCLLPHPQ